ncbi:hypothetical protein [Rhizobium oryziradicis]|nr:hypothetical protein [Rhizobium oryziradicis]
MMDIIKIPAAMVAGMAIAALALVVFYDGISLPYFGQVIDGRLQNAVEAAKAGLVAQADLDAANAKLAAMTLRAQQAEALAEQARATGEKITEKEGQGDDALKASVAADHRGDGARWSASDINWLCNERRRLGIIGACGGGQSGR